jgi:hypothetical protein
VDREQPVLSSEVLEHFDVRAERCEFAFCDEAVNVSFWIGTRLNGANVKFPVEFGPDN